MKTYYVIINHRNLLYILCANNILSMCFFINRNYCQCCQNNMAAPIEISADFVSVSKKCLVPLNCGHNIVRLLIGDIDWDMTILIVLYFVHQRMCILVNSTYLKRTLSSKSIPGILGFYMGVSITSPFGGPLRGPPQGHIMGIIVCVSNSHTYCIH